MVGYTTRIAIPADAARSYATSLLCIAWFIRVAVQFDGEPELRRDWYLSVY